MTKLMQWIATIVFVVGGILLLCRPSHAQEAAGARAAMPTRFTVVDEGTTGKPDVVLIPGLTSSREVWAEEAALLSPNYRLHLVQLNGFAGQAAGPNATGEILPGVVDELHVYCETLRTKPVVIGHSLGGLLTVLLADKYPADVKKIVIVDALPFYGMLFGPTTTVETIRPQAAKMRDGLIAQTPDERKAGAQKTADALVNDAAGKKLVEKNSEDSDGSVFARALYEDLQTDVRPELAKIKVTALMIYPYDTAFGTDTKQVDALYQGAYKAMPNVTVVRVDGARHFVMLDQSKKVDELIEGFLRE